MKKLGLSLILGNLLLGGPASAVIGTIDAVPAATLLLPYFEVDIANSNGVTTLFSINNASNLAVLAHVTVWTDQSVPALDFDVYLTGYDVQSIDLREIFVNGNLPRTASAGQDPNDDISPQGPVSQDIDFASCSVLPYAPGAVSASFRAHLQAWFQGNQSPATGNCAGSKQPDTGVLRGYVTVDTVNACNLFFPSDWAFYDQFVTDQNVLWGDYFYVNPDPVTGNFASGDTLVHIEACSTCFAPGNHTFYGRYNGATAADAREPLPTTMAVPFDISNGGSTDFLVWREANESDSAYNCSLQGPATWYPLRFAQVALFDEEEQGVNPEPCCCIDPPCPPIVSIPNESNRIDVDGGLLSPFNSGWAYLNLQHGKVFPIYGDTAAQTWVTTVMETSGRFSVGFSGIQLDNANTPVECCIPVPDRR